MELLALPHHWMIDPYDIVLTIEKDSHKLIKWIFTNLIQRGDRRRRSHCICRANGDSRHEQAHYNPGIAETGNIHVSAAAAARSYPFANSAGHRDCDDLLLCHLTIYEFPCVQIVAVGDGGAYV